MQVRKDAKNVLFTLALKSRVHIAKTDVHKIDLSPPNMLKKKVQNGYLRGLTELLALKINMNIHHFKRTFQDLECIEFKEHGVFNMP